MMDKAAEMQISVWFSNQHIFTSTNISQDSALVVKAIENAMKKDYVVGACNTGH
jgi:hypothetical protein